MSFFALLFRKELGARLFSRRFLAGAALVLFLTGSLAFLLPGPAPAGFTVGLLAEEGGDGETVIRLLAEHENLAFFEVPDRDALERGVLTGRFHCGYVFGADGSVTAVSGEGSYLRPVLDEVVFSEVQRASLEQTAAAFLERKGLSAAGVAVDGGVGIGIILKAEGSAPEDALADYAGSGAQPLLYAALITAAFAGAIIASPEEEQSARAYDLLGKISGRVWQARSAPIFARSVCTLLMLAAADLLFGCFVSYSVYSVTARAAMLALLAFLSSGAALAAARLGRARSVLYCALPALLLGSVFLSGAVIDPAYLPGPLPVLRFLTPSWWLLRLMAGLS